LGPVHETRSFRRLIAMTAAAVIALDAVTKAVAVHYLTERGTVTVLGGALRFEVYRNFAGPRNTFQGHPVLVSMMAMAGIAAITLLAGRVRRTSAAIAVGLLLGGGMGNLLDRLLRAPGPLRGGVIDWLKPAWSSGTMNLADLAITAAVLVVAGSAAGSWWRTRRTPIAPAA
jgi:signal peptidase II